MGEGLNPDVGQQAMFGEEKKKQRPPRPRIERPKRDAEKEENGANPLMKDKRYLS